MEQAQVQSNRDGFLKKKVDLISRLSSAVMDPIEERYFHSQGAKAATLPEISKKCEEVNCEVVKNLIVEKFSSQLVIVEHCGVEFVLPTKSGKIEYDVSKFKGRFNDLLLSEIADGYLNQSRNWGFSIGDIITVPCLSFIHDSYFSQLQKSGFVSKLVQQLFQSGALLPVDKVESIGLTTLFIAPNAEFLNHKYPGRDFRDAIHNSPYNRAINLSILKSIEAGVVAKEKIVATFSPAQLAIVNGQLEYLQNKGFIALESAEPAIYKRTEKVKGGFFETEDKRRASRRIEIPDSIDREIVEAIATILVTNPFGARYDLIKRCSLCSENELNTRLKKMQHYVVFADEVVCSETEPSQTASIGERYFLTTRMLELYLPQLGFKGRDPETAIGTLAAFEDRVCGIFKEGAMHLRADDDRDVSNAELCSYPLSVLGEELKLLESELKTLISMRKLSFFTVNQEDQSRVYPTHELLGRKLVPEEFSTLSSGALELSDFNFYVRAEILKSRDKGISLNKLRTIFPARKNLDNALVQLVNEGSVKSYLQADEPSRAVYHDAGLIPQIQKRQGRPKKDNSSDSEPKAESSE